MQPAPSAPLQLWQWPQQFLSCQGPQGPGRTKGCPTVAVEQKHHLHSLKIAKKNSKDITYHLQSPQPVATLFSCALRTPIDGSTATGPRRIQTLFAKVLQCAWILSMCLPSPDALAVYFIKSVVTIFLLTFGTLRNHCKCCQTATQREDRDPLEEWQSDMVADVPLQERKIYNQESINSRVWLISANYFFFWCFQGKHGKGKQWVNKVLRIAMHSKKAVKKNKSDRSVQKLCKSSTNFLKTSTSVSVLLAWYRVTLEDT